MNVDEPGFREEPTAEHGQPADRESPAGQPEGRREDRPLPSLPARLGQVFFAPAKLFDALRERPAWIGPLVVVAVATLAMTLLVPEELMREAVIAQAGEDATPEQIETAVSIGRWIPIVASVVGPPIVAAIIAGLLLFLYNTVLGGMSTFRQLFSATSHAMIIPALGTVITTPLAISAGDLNTSLALHLLVPGLEVDTYLYDLLHGLNVFSLATAVVLGIAVSRLYPRRTAGSSALTIVGVYVVLKAVVAVF